MGENGLHCGFGHIESIILLVKLKVLLGEKSHVEDGRRE